MGARIGVRIGRNTGLSMGPVGWAVVMTLSLPFLMLYWSYRLVAYVVHQIAKGR